MIRTLADATGTALRARTDALQRAAFAHHDRLHIDIAVVELLGLIRILLLPVVNGAAEELLQTDRRFSLREVKEVECTVNLYTSDSVSHKTHLARRCRDIIQFGYSGVPLGLFQPFGHFFFTFTHNAISLGVLLLVIARVSAERTRRGELTQLVTHHVLSHVNGNKLITVMNCDRVADKVRGDHAGARPRLDNLFLLATIIHSKNPLLQGFLDIWTFS